jgi:hypothetical protein
VARVRRFCFRATNATYAPFDCGTASCSTARTRHASQGQCQVLLRARRGIVMEAVIVALIRCGVTTFASTACSTALPSLSFSSIHWSRFWSLLSAPLSSFLFSFSGRDVFCDGADSACCVLETPGLCGELGCFRFLVVRCVRPSESAKRDANGVCSCRPWWARFGLGHGVGCDHVLFHRDVRRQLFCSHLVQLC